MAHSASTPSSIVLAIYAVTVFVSAFLLFQVQPLISKFILPWFGGSPAVWTTAMLFFQVALCAGYGYAHWLSANLAARAQFWVHATLLTIAAAVTAYTRIMPMDALKPSGAETESPMVLILVLLTTTVGLPYFVLSSTGPLLTKWFGDAYPGTSAYRLFALSNVGSLAALLTFPFVFEPMWDSRQQAFYWSMGMAVFAVLGTLCAYWTFVARARRDTEPDRSGGNHVAPHEIAPGLSSWLLWIALPALASVMFLAVTNELCQNVATFPLLWILPLSIYLISFIIAFDSPGWYSRVAYCTLTLVMLVALAHFDLAAEWASEALNRLAGISRTDQGAYRLWADLPVQCGTYLGVLALVCCVCHCEMARLKPSSKYVTAYFMTMSVGGAIGGLLVNLVCPKVFSTFFELPLAMLAAAVTATVFLTIPGGGRREADPSKSLSRKASPALGFAFGAAALILMLFSPSFDSRDTVDTKGRNGTIYRGRNFYGLVSVQHRSQFLNEAGDGLNPDENYTFFSGHIRHGRQYARQNPLSEQTLAAHLVSLTDEEDRQEALLNNADLPQAELDRKTRSSTAIAYWGPGTGCDAAMRYVITRPNCRIGIVGLGIGTIAGYAKKGDYIRAYEINPLVRDIAENAEWFTYLADARERGVDIDVVLGDARLKLEYELRHSGSHEFDVLCLDAFAGDAVPTHLITDEAFALYKQHLKAKAIIVVNITNTYLDLYPVIRGLADKHGLKWTRIYDKGNSDNLLYRTYYMLLTNDDEFLAKTPSRTEDMHAGPRHARFLKERTVPLWTDRYSSLLPIIQH